uniref:FBA_2 domain-containing protein n=1 Tax=Caenorhabditis tropicalis TaxID=1561998 RepID=A0A1I7V1V8_9PELO
MSKFNEKYGVAGKRNIFTEMFHHIQNVFGVNPQKFILQPPFLWILNLSNGTSASVTIEPDKIPIDEEECKYILKNCKTQDLSIKVDFPQGFRYFGPFASHQKIKICDGSWLILENLISIGKSCTHIIIEKSNLTTRDINSFLKFWYNQKVNCFRRLTINFEFVNKVSLFDGLEHGTKVIEETMKHECVGDTVQLDAGFTVLQRKDGMIATVLSDDRYKRLTIYVWTSLEPF